MVIKRIMFISLVCCVFGSFFAMDKDYKVTLRDNSFNVTKKTIGQFDTYNCENNFKAGKVSLDNLKNGLPVKKSSSQTEKKEWNITRYFLDSNNKRNKPLH